MTVPNINYFNFKELADCFLLTNDTGRFIFLNKKEFRQFVNNSSDIEEDLLHKLSDRYFITNMHKELFVNEVAVEVRRRKGYLFEGTQLHIFVLTGNCNQKCIYCQASANENPYSSKCMTPEIAEKAVNIAFQSPSKNLTIEFQGGEPLLNFEVLKHIIEYTYVKNMNSQKNINFNLVSNLISLNDDMLNFLVENKVNISTSLDGHEFLHKLNRPSIIPDYYNKIKRNILRINDASLKNSFSIGKVQAIQTTTKHSLKFPKEIIDEYVSLGFNSIFLRPLSPMGFAKNNWNRIGYTAEEFIDFYLRAMEYIIELSVSGINISETYTTIFLRKIINNDSINYMELRSPCGGSIGQLAYNYEGSIFTCDEGRMLSETGDDSFKLGNVYESDYKDLIDNRITKTICISSCLEIIPGCEECVYSPYCGTCPIYNYVQGGSLFSLMPANYKCKINKGILDYVFNKLKENDKRVMDVFEKWLI